MLLAPLPVQAQEGFWPTVNDSRQLFEIKEYAQALKRIEHAKQLAQGEQQRATVALYEGLILANMGRQHQAQAASAFREALLLAPWAKLPAGASAQVEREYEEVRVLVQRGMGSPQRGASEPSRPSAPVPVQENFGSAMRAIQHSFESQEYEQTLKHYERAKQLVRHEEQRVTLSLFLGVILASLGEQQRARAISSFREGLSLVPWAKLPLRTSPQVEREFAQVQARAPQVPNSRPTAPSDDKAAWKTTGSMLKAREAHTATLLRTGKVLVTGGMGPGGSLPDAELYDPKAGTWSSTDSMSIGRHHHTATPLRTGEVLVTGGESQEQGVLSSAELYNPEKGTWSPAGDMTTSRHHHTATLLLSGKVLVTGGEDTSGDRLASAEVYDPETGLWTPTGSMSSERIYHQAIRLSSGKVLVMGGLSTNGNLSSAEVYDPDSGTWSPTSGGLPVGVFEHRATLLNSGKVLVTGGDDGRAALPNAVLYDPNTNTWTPCSTHMKAERIAHSAILLRSGKVLVFGGESRDSQAPSGSEIYNPVTDTWAPTTNMATSRFWHTATELPSGDVLITGGRAHDDTLLNSAELYQYKP